jgi:hypothetical protein
VVAAAGAPDGLAIDRHHLALDLPCQGPRPSHEAGLEHVRIDQHEDPSERVVRGDAVRQGQEGLQPSLLAAPVELHIFPALGAGDHRANRDHEEVDQPMITLPGLTRIIEPGEARRQTFDHAARPPSW